MPKKKANWIVSSTASTGSTVFEATLGPNGRVIRGNVITQQQAEVLRANGRDVVVCGPDLAANRSLARTIELNANGTAKRCPPHPNAGLEALPHFQPDPRPPSGHTSYETPNRKASS
jgi:hypothetical protein